MNRFVSKPFRIARDEREHRNQRWDLILRGVDHLGCSYEGRVFLNNRDATADTPLETEFGYAGGYFIFGHGDCYGAPGHCDPPPPRLPYDTTPITQALPEEVHVEISDAVNRLDATDSVTISIVAIVNSVAPGQSADPEDTLKIAGPISIVGYA